MTFEDNSLQTQIQVLKELLESSQSLIQAQNQTIQNQNLTIQSLNQRAQTQTSLLSQPFSGNDLTPNWESPEVVFADEHPDLDPIEFPESVEATAYAIVEEGENNNG
jgi:hypothetical protein